MLEIVIKALCNSLTRQAGDNFLHQSQLRLINDNIIYSRLLSHRTLNTKLMSNSTMSNVYVGKNNKYIDIVPNIEGET